jgi:hypothetical protein
MTAMRLNVEEDPDWMKNELIRITKVRRCRLTNQTRVESAWN